MLKVAQAVLNDDTLMYTYKPLVGYDTIRLIELQPSCEPEATFHCRLIEVSLSACDKRDIFGYYMYTALSYVWGCPDKTKRVYIDGTRLMITQNLYSALRDLRDETRVFLLWADGICINQDDNKEKARQIGLMGQIYATAQHTVIYLGPADIDGLDSHSLAALSPRRSQDDNTDSIVSVKPILRKEWFTRVWVFQELVFSQSPWIQCGKTRIKWAQFAEVMHLYAVEIKGIQVLGDMEQARREHHTASETGDAEEHDAALETPNKRYARRNELLDLLEARRGTGVTDPRDMIFAHLGFASDSRQGDLRVDYSMTDVQLYTTCARYLVKEYGIPTVLRCVLDSAVHTSRKDLPSWSPDWTIPSLDRSHYQFSGPSHQTEVTKIPLESDSVIACGVPWANFIVSISLELSAHRIPTESRQRVISSWTRVDAQFKQEGHVLDGIWVAQKSFDEIRKVWADVYTVWRKAVNDDSVLPATPDEYSFTYNRTLHEPHDSRLGFTVPLILVLIITGHLESQHIEGKRLARMASGNLALVPVSVQVGDIIVSMADETTPTTDFVFHPLSPSDKHSRIDDDIFQAVLGMFLEDETLDLSLEQIKLAIPSIKHYGFVTDCFLDDSYSLRKNKVHNVTEPFIMALH
ncbi:heterokaryon incompatibility protein-domain-containing protein [Xylogone sp. PMI_703]|nr:heterokaryon incompatibility protein-domain-containing protein [Xylogone sp. PMI_703]